VSNQKKEATLKKYTKNELVEYCLVLQKNNLALKESFEIQYQNCINMVNQMNLLNERLKEAIKLGS